MNQPNTFDDPRIAQLRDTARRAVREHIEPHGDAWEATGTTPHTAYRALGAQGLLGLCHAKEDGGGGLGPVVFAEEISASYGGVAEAVLIHTDMSSTHIGHRGTEAQRRRYLPGMLSGELICGIAVTEPEAGSDLAAMRTTAVGMARRALEPTLAYVKSRKAFGGTLWDLQATRQRLAMLAARHQAVTALVHGTAARAAQGPDCVREGSMVKALAGETGQDVMRECLQLHGGAGYMADCPIERLTRDARILTIGGGATEVMLEEVAKRLNEEYFR